MVVVVVVASGEVVAEWCAVITNTVKGYYHPTAGWATGDEQLPKS